MGCYGSGCGAYCRECQKCLKSKFSWLLCALLVNMPIGRPWQMVSVDILEVPKSTNNNRYLLVVQDYFMKWPDAIPLHDQAAICNTGELTKLFSQFDHPDILHSDQGHNLESSTLSQTLEAFGIQKLRTTAYHSEGDGMIEHFNRSLLQLLRTYVDSQTDWEHYLSLVLYAYHTSVHSSTAVSPFLLMFGRSPKPVPFSSPTAFDPPSHILHTYKLNLQNSWFVESNLTAAAHNQKHSYDHHTSPPSFSVVNLVWLSVLTAGRLDPMREEE